MSKTTRVYFGVLQFISCFTDRLKSFLTTLKGAEQTSCNKECDQSFMEIKQYLTEQPILASLEVGDTLYLYITVSDVSMSVALFKEYENRKQRPEFFVRKSLSEVET